MDKRKPIQVGNLKIGEGMPKICVPITGKTEEEILSQAGKIAQAGPDLVEWRADFYEDVMDYDKVKKLLVAIFDILGQIPLLFTFRTDREGGCRPISTKDYVNLNHMVSERKEAALIDVEVFMDIPKMAWLIEEIHKNGKKVIGSHHRFDLTPSRSDMITVLKTLEENGADIVKLAVMPKSEEDVTNLIQATSEAVSGELTRPAVTMSMGSLGVISRTTGEKFGSGITFGCVGEASAPGQIPLETLREELEKVHKSI